MIRFSVLRVSLFALSMFLVSAPFAFAAYYQPGQTLDPACAPSDPGCGIASSTSVSAGLAGQVPYYLSDGNVLTATSSLTILQNGNVGIGTTSPAAKLHIYDGTLLVDSPITLSIAGSLNVTNVTAVAVSGHYAYMAAGYNFVIADITDPTNPVLVSSTAIPNANYSTGVRVEGRYAYLADGGGGTRVADISNPVAPVFLGEFVDQSGNGFTNNLYVQGKYVYEAKANGGLNIINVSNPSSPFQAQTGNLGGGGNIGPSDVFVQGRYAYVSYHDNVKAVRIYDISNPVTPTLVGTYSNTVGFFYTYVSGKYLYADAGTDGLDVIDISNPASPTLAGQYTPGGSGTLNSSIIVAGKYAYTGDVTNGKFYAIDVSSPTNPKLVSATNGIYPGNSSLGNSIAISGKYAYVADETSGALKIIDLEGASISAANIGNLESSDANILNGLTIGNSVSIGNALNVGTGGIYSNGPLSVSLASTTDTAEVSGYFQGRVGIGTTTPYSRLTIWGQDALASTSAFTIANSASTTEFQVFDNGSATLAGPLTQNSDRRLKTNVQQLDGSSTLAAILQLNPVDFNWIDPSSGTSQQLGFIAQDVQQIFPQLVSTTSATALTPDGTLGVNYIGLIAPAIEAIKELASEVQGFAQSFTSQTITAKQELCVGDTCVTESQLKALLQTSGQTPTSVSAPAQAQSDDSGTASSTSPDDSTVATSTDDSSSDNVVQPAPDPDTDSPDTDSATSSSS